MSVFFPYNITETINNLENLFNIDLSILSEYQEIILTIGINLYFFIIWFIICYFALKGINWVYERLC